MCASRAKTRALSSGGAEVAGKSLELIRELIPAVRRVGVLADESDPFAEAYVAQIGHAARSVGLEVEPIMTRPANRWNRYS
jgi:putative ABC transport system substrate-binding protein